MRQVQKHQQMENGGVRVGTSGAVEGRLPPLTGYRALDLTQYEENVCGKMMADLGVEVIRVEPPHGDPTRRRGPFYHDDPSPEKSLFFWYYNRGKRAITLNLSSPDGQALFEKLVPKVDWVIESFPAGTLEKLGVGWERLKELNPRLILTSITPFGANGPYKSFLGPDLVLSALGGASFLAGDPQRQPLRISFPQYHLHAGAEACAASMIAHWDRQKRGRGHHVTVAAQLSVIRTLMNATGFPPMQHEVLQREGAWMKLGTIPIPAAIPCKDGYATIMLVGGSLGSSINTLVQWMQEEGFSVEAIGSRDWKELDFIELLQMGEAGSNFIQQVVNEVEQFFATHTKAELFEGAVQRRILLAPINNVQDIAQDVQLAARDYWREVEHETEGTKLRYPGPWVKMSVTSLVDNPKRAPRIGEDNVAIYQGELGLSTEQLHSLAQAGVI